MSEMTSERITGFIESLNEEQKEVYEYLSEYLYQKGTEASTSHERTVFTNPREFDMDFYLEFEEMAEAYDEGVKEALKYAGMTDVLSGSGISLETIELLIVNDMALKSKGEVDKNSILDEEATKF